ncbi:MAG TPA: hypothetical protein VF855_05100 [Acidimicrobiales bacterium]
MSTPWRLLAIPAVAVALVTSCGGDDSSGGAGPASTIPASTTASPTSTAAATTTVPVTSDVTTSPAPTTIKPETPVSGDVVEIIVKVGEDSSPDRVETVSLGSDVLLRVQSEKADEIHVHDYDLELTVPAGGEAAFEFTADKAGRFEIESHSTDEVLMVLEVS